MIRFAITRGLAALIGATLVLSILTPQRALAAPTQITWTPSTLHTSPDSINCENPGFCPALLKIAVDYHGNNIFTGDFGGHNLFHSNDGGENFSLHGVLKNPTMEISSGMLKPIFVNAG